MAVPRECSNRECMVGLNMLHFPASQTVHCFLVVFALFLSSWTTFFTIWRKYKSVTVRRVSTLLIGAGWGMGWYFLQPRYPYWINELSVTTYITSTWHLQDWICWRSTETLPPNASLGSLMLHDALVLRPHVLRHRPGAKPNTGRTLAQRCRQAMPSMGLLTIQYLGCEALNAWLMQQSTEDVMYGHIVYRMAASLAFAMGLYLHLSYFFHSMAVLNIIVFDSTPEDWPPVFKAPWAAASPTEFWNERWHQMFRWWFTRLVFKPTRSLMLHLVSAAEDNSSKISSDHSNGLVTTGPAASNAPAGSQERASDLHNGLNLTSLGNGFHLVPAEQPTGVTSHASLQDGEEGTGSPRRSGRLKVASTKAAAAPHPSTLADTPLRRRHQVHLQASSCTSYSDTAMTSNPPQQEAAGPLSQSNILQQLSAAGQCNGATCQHHGHGSEGDGSHGVAAPGSAMQPPDMQVMERVEKRDPGSHVLVQAVPLMAVFFASGLFHEVLLTLFFGAPSGEQMAFFLLHGAGVLVHKAWQRVRARGGGPLPRWAGIAMFNTFLIYSTLLFIRPWFRYSYHLELRVPFPGPVHWAVTGLITNRQ